MAGRKLDNSLYLDSNWKDEIESKDFRKKGLYNLDFTSIDGTAEPTIQAGSSIDIDGVLYVFDSLESISGTETSGSYNYIRVYDSGGSAYAEYTTDALPDYDYEKLGYYSSNKRWVLRFFYDGTSYTKKETLDLQPQKHYNFENLFKQTKLNNWATRKNSVNNNWLSVCWSSELDLFCAVSNTGTSDHIMTSPDGAVWTTRTSPAAVGSWRSVCWSPDLTLFCAVSGGTVNNDVMTSPDGITWTGRVEAASINWVSVCWSPELNLFCAVSNFGGGTNSVMTSPDGITWTIRTAPNTNYWEGVCWSSELNLFCAVGTTGVGNRVMTSPDGITWTARTSAADNQWRSVCWSPELNLFCAVSASGTGNRVMTSPDGLTWSVKTSASDSTWNSVCWAPDIGMFCAVADNAVTMYSFDGVTWYGSGATEAVTNDWEGVCWSPELNLFCAVSSSGTDDRVMVA